MTPDNIQSISHLTGQPESHENLCDLSIGMYGTFFTIFSKAHLHMPNGKKNNKKKAKQVHGNLT